MATLICEQRTMPTQKHQATLLTAAPFENPDCVLLSGEPQLFQSAGQFILCGDSLPCYRLSSIGLCSSSLISLF